MKKINRCFLAFALAGSVAACNQSADSTASADSAAKASDTNTVSTDGTAPPR